jgi:hypothetical protein
MSAEPADEADRGRHPGMSSFNVIAGGPGSLSLSFGGGRAYGEVMANYCFLCVTNTKTIYPNWASRRFDPDRQFVSSDVYCIPLLWFALFRPGDMNRKTFTLEGRKVAVQAPLTTVKKAIGNLDEAVPYFNRLFRREGPLDEYAAFLRQALEGIEYRYITIDLHEIAIMYQTRKEFYGDFRTALECIDLEYVTPGAKNHFQNIETVAKKLGFP